MQIVPTPAVLYKYMTAERVLTCLPEFGNGTLRATQPAALNDPFECAVRSGAGYSSEEDGNRQLAEALSNINGTTPVTEREVAAAKIQDGSLYLRNLLTKQLSQRFGIVSFATDPRDPLMWSHYTRDSSGFVVGYDSEGLEAIIAGKGCLRPVSYRVEMERIYGYNIFYDNGSDENPNIALSLKSDRWQHEAEWRLIVELNETIGTGLSDSRGMSINLLPILNEAVVDVYYTERTPRDAVDVVTARLRNNNNRYGVRLPMKLVMSPDSYGYVDAHP